MLEAKTYARILIAALVPVWGVITWFVLTTPPYEGDMTRIGGYSETDFGPRLERTVFAEPAYDKAFSVSDYTGAYDVVVVGDSFSQNRSYGWQNFLVEQTGWSMLTFHHNDAPLSDLVRSPAFVKHPPKLMIYEIVEHGVHGFGFEDQGAPLPRDPRPAQSIAVHGAELERVVEVAPRKKRLVIEHGAHRLKRGLKKATGSRTKAYRLELSRADLFSNSASSEVLIYHGDFWKNEVSAEQWDRVARRLEKLRVLVESNGQTRFVLMIASDKATIYRPYIDAPPKPILSSVDCLGPLDANRIPLQEALSRCVEAGAVDVYQPNDTHWGYAGHQCAADAVLTYLRDKDLITNQ